MPNNEMSSLRAELLDMQRGSMKKKMEPYMLFEKNFNDEEQRMRQQIMDEVFTLLRERLGGNNGFNGDLQNEDFFRHLQRGPQETEAPQRRYGLY